MRGSEFFRKSIHTKGLQRGIRFARFEIVNAAEMAAICKTQHAAIEFEGHVNVDVVRRLVGLGEEFFYRGKPQKPAIEAKVKDGVLTVRIPKRAEDRPRKIAIQ